MISILIPAYNTEQWIGRCLLSAAKQDYTGQYEIVVADDGSTDHTVDRVREIQAEYPGKVKLFCMAHQGAAAARNMCMEHAGGDFFFWLDSDDYLAEDTLSVCTRLMQKYHVDAIRIDFRHPGPRKEKLYSHDEYMELLLGDKIKSFLIGTLLYRKYYTERFRDGELVEDYAYHPHLMDLVPEILVVSDESLYHYTENRPGSTTYLTGIRAAGISARLANAEKRYREYHGRYPEACKIIRGQMADYTVMAILSDDSGVREMAGHVLKEYRGLFCKSRYVPVFRKLEIISLSAFPYSRHLLTEIHQWKGKHFGIRKTDRRFR